MLQSSDLGSLSYNLQLKATSSRPERPVYFRTTLGSRQTITAKIRNFAQQKTEYLLEVSPGCWGSGWEAAPVASTSPLHQGVQVPLAWPGRARVAM